MMEQGLTEKLQSVLEGAGPEGREILTWRYGLDGKGSRTLDEIGKALNISKERVAIEIEERVHEKGIRGSKDVVKPPGFVA